MATVHDLAAYRRGKSNLAALHSLSRSRSWASTLPASVLADIGAWWDEAARINLEAWGALLVRPGAGRPAQVIVFIDECDAVATEELMHCATSPPQPDEREQRRQLLRNTKGPRASRWS